MAEQQWFPVDGISDDEWRAALGDREVPHGKPCSIDRCELGVCCGAISDVRDVLYKCREQGGLFEADVDWIRDLLDGAGHTLPPGPVLTRVGAALGIEAKQEGESDG